MQHDFSVFIMRGITPNLGNSPNCNPDRRLSRRLFFSLAFLAVIPACAPPQDRSKVYALSDIQQGKEQVFTGMMIRIDITGVQVKLHEREPRRSYDNGSYYIHKLIITDSQEELFILADTRELVLTPNALAVAMSGAPNYYCLDMRRESPLQRK